MSRRFLIAALACTTGVLSACQMPRFEGPDIQNPPMGFLRQNESYQGRRMFPEREVTFHTAWVHTDMNGVSVIYVNGHRGALTLEDAVAAQRGVWDATMDPDTHFEDLQAITIDGRSGWGWYEHVSSERRGLVDVAYRAIVPYDTVTFAIEFVSGEPAYKQFAPDTLQTVVSSFGIGRTEWNLPLIAILTGGILLMVNVLRTRARERATRLRSINFVKIEKKEEESPDPGPSDPSAQ